MAMEFMQNFAHGHHFQTYDIDQCSIHTKLFQFLLSLESNILCVGHFDPQRQSFNVPN